MCPPSGYVNGGGPFPQLTATTLPWAGNLVNLRGTGLPQFAFVFPIVGFAPVSLPLVWFGLVPVLAFGTAVVASLVPALRALRQSPAESVRYE